MENPPADDHFNVKLQIAFPKSSEDHRLQLVQINGAVFAILHSPLESNGPINLNCQDWSLVLLSPIRSKTHVEITAINIICLNEVKSEEGDVTIQASNRLVQLTPGIKHSESSIAVGENGQFLLDDDPGAFLKYFKLFNKIVSGARDENPDSLKETHQNFILGLCALAEMIEGKTIDLDLHKILAFWEIPDLTA